MLQAIHSSTHLLQFRSASLKLGFVPLIDAAPLIAALELGFFLSEGLSVTLERQIGWGNIRDKLTFGHLDASHALVGMPVASNIAGNMHSNAAVDHDDGELVAVMALGSGGNAITLSNRLVNEGVISGPTLARWIKARTVERRPTLAHVFGCSMHHYLLREWLAMSGLDADVDVRLCVLPPIQMVRQMEAGCIDGFCAGEPWNTVAVRDGAGCIIAATTDIIPEHPEKVLAVTRRWLTANAAILSGLVRAVLRGCAYCADSRNHGELARMLSKPAFLASPVQVIEQSLAFDKSTAAGSAQQLLRPREWLVRSFAPDSTFPSATHAAWMLEQMVRWGHVPDDIEVTAMAARCVDARFYRQAAASLGLECPPHDFARMQLRNGFYDPMPQATPAAAGV